MGLRILQHLPAGLSLLLDRRVFLEAHGVFLEAPQAPLVQPLGAPDQEPAIIKCRDTVPLAESQPRV